MQGMLVKFALWLSQKLVAAALIVLVALAGYGLWLYLQEEVISEERRVEQIDRAMAERVRTQVDRPAVPTSGGSNS